MGFEFQMLDGLQTIHTSFLDTFMTSITKLGDAGIVWIITDTKNKKSRRIHGSGIDR